jgi:hypothetical protein
LVAADNTVALHVRLDEIEDAEKKLVDLEAMCTQLAERAVMRRGLAVGAMLTAQNAILAYGTWWAYSWDVMEPICYFVSSSVVAWGAFYYSFIQRENSYKTLFGRMLERRLQKLFHEHRFDPELLARLREEKSLIKRHLLYDLEHRK